MSYFVYILQSLKDKSYYVGYSTDPLIRLKKHNSAHKGYTATKKPWELVYVETLEDKRQAIIREKYSKSQKSSIYLAKLIDDSSNQAQTFL